MSVSDCELLSQDADRPGRLYFGGARMVLLDIEAGFWGLCRQIEALVGRRLADAVLQQAGANGGASFARAFIDQTPAPDGPRALRDCIAAYQAAGFGHFKVEVLEWPIGRAVIRAWDTFESWASSRHRQATAEPACAYSAGVLVGFVNVIADRHDIVCIKRACQAQGAESCLFELLPATDAGDVPVTALNPDPALGRQLNLLEILFERMPMGIAVFDRDIRVRRFNPTWAEFVTRYTPALRGPVVPGVSYFDLDPGTEANVKPVFERALAGETVHLRAFPITSGGVTSYWDAVLTPLVEDGQVAGFLDVTTDATERVLAQRNLEQRVEERTHELATLLEISHSVASTLELEPLLGLVLDELRNVVDYDGGTILTVEDEHLVVRAYRGPMSQKDALRMRFPVKDPLDRLVLLKQAPVIVPDTHGDTPQARAYRESVGDRLETTFSHIHSWMGVPLVIKGQVIGELALDHREPGHFVPQHAELSQTFANQVAVAIENARLYEETRQRLAETTSLQRVTTALLQTLSLKEILEIVCTEAQKLTGATGCTVFLLEDDEWLRMAFTIGTERPPFDGLPADGSLTGLAVRTGTPLVSNDPLNDERVLHRNRGLQSVLIAPLTVEGVAVGALDVLNKRAGFTEEDVRIISLLADQAAIAIEKARLTAQAEELAVMQERQRLARELHDSVSQALYGIGLGARTARTLLDQEPVAEETKAKLARPLDYTLSLAQAGLAEMRALIFELHPDALEREGLVAALKRRAAALQARYKLEVQAEFCKEPELAIEVKETFYRIAQEALNNVVKHARANQVGIRLDSCAGMVTLEVQDDGVGFDPHKEYLGHLGLQSMRERISELGGTLEIESQLGHGTLIRARAPVSELSHRG